MPTQTQEIVTEEQEPQAKARKLQNLLEREMTWKKGRSTEFPFVSEFEGLKCLVRLNDFPAQHLYTLIVASDEVSDFDDWPEQWQRP